jgi:hypothetical protein
MKDSGPREDYYCGSVFRLNRKLGGSDLGLLTMKLFSPSVSPENESDNFYAIIKVFFEKHPPGSAFFFLVDLQKLM